MNDAGLLSYWKKQEYMKHNIPELNDYSDHDDESYQPFSICHLQSLFYVLMASIVISTICFICEFIYFFIAKKINKKKF